MPCSGAGRPAWMACVLGPGVMATMMADGAAWRRRRSAVRTVEAGQLELVAERVLHEGLRAVGDDGGGLHRAAVTLEALGERRELGPGPAGGARLGHVREEVQLALAGTGGEPQEATVAERLGHGLLGEPEQSGVKAPGVAGALGRVRQPDVLQARL